MRHDRPAHEGVERSGVYIVRVGARFVVADHRDAVFPYAHVGPRDGFDSVDAAYAVAEAVLAEQPLLQAIAARVREGQEGGEQSLQFSGC